MLNKNTLKIIILIAFIDIISYTMLIPLITPMFQESGLFGSQYNPIYLKLLLGISFTLFPIFQFLISPAIGFYSDKIGRRNIIIWSLFFTVIARIFVFTSFQNGSVALFYISNILDGITGAMYGVIFSSIADVSKEEEKAKNFGLVGAAFGIGFIIGPALGGILSLLPNYYFLVAVISVLITIINLWLGYKYIKETLPVEKRSKEEVHPIRLIYKIFDVFKYKKVLPLIMVIFIGTLSFQFFTNFYYDYYIDTRNITALQIGAVFGVIGISIAFFQGYFNNILMKYFSSKQMIVVGHVILFVTIAALLYPSFSNIGIWLSFIISIFVAAGRSIVDPNLLAELSAEAGDKQGEILGYNQALSALAMAIPGILGGFLATININLPMLTASLITVLGLFVYLYSKRKVV